MRRNLIRFCLLLILAWVGHILVNAPVTTSSNDWSISTIDDGDGGFYVHHSYTSIAVDGEDKVQISYRGPDHDLRYATNKNEGWSTDVVYDIAVAVARENAIAIDSNDNVHIAYNNFGSLTYVTNLSGSWKITVIGACDGIDCDPAIALDSNDKVHISYSASGGDLKYATNISGSWVTSTVASKVSAGRYHAIAIDNDNKVHLSYYDSIESDLGYANNVTGSWLTYTIDSEGDVGRANSIAIDSQNNVHISYRYDTASLAKLKYATNAPASSYRVYLLLIMRNP